MHDTDMTNAINDLVAEVTLLKRNLQNKEDLNTALSADLIRVLDRETALINKVNEANTQIRGVVETLINIYGISREDVYNLFGWELPKKSFNVRVPVQASVTVTVLAANEDEALEMLSESDVDNRIRNEIRYLSHNYDFEIDPRGNAHVEDNFGYVTDIIPTFISN